MSEIKRGDFPAGEEGLKQYNDAWHKANPRWKRPIYGSAKKKAYMKEYNFRRNFKFSTEEYETMLEQQGGVCACCNSPDYRKTLAVDHDHNTGKVRGLLCHTCNNHLGIFERKYQMFKEYLAKCT